jgi:OOP family OmpA-OmpF porin
MMNTASRLRPFGIAVFTLGLLASASASGAEDGFALNRFEPSERGSDWFALESLNLKGNGRWATGVVGDWSHRPLVLYDEAGNEVQALLGDQLYAYIGGSVVFADRIRMGLTFPVMLVSSGDPADAGVPTVPVSSGANVGDLRLSGDVRLFGEHRDVITMALGVHVHAPTGSSGALSSDGKFRAQPHLLAAGRIGSFEYAGRTGMNLRGTSNFAGAEFGSEWVFAAAAGVRMLNDQLLVGPELWGGTLVSSSIGAFDQEGTPVEALLGAHYHVHEWHFGFGAGPGLSRGLGTPQLRMLASLQWVQDEAEPVIEPPPPLDRDGDTIIDANDACPLEAGPQSSEPNKNGCPLPKDGDADGILDPDDACPAQAGEKSDDPRQHGCPPPDSDGDGVLDRDDACVSEAGVASTDRAKNGCPLPKDSDGDTITDDLDACPQLAGEPDPEPTKNGCPRVRLQGDEVKVLDRIEFENAKATLTSESEPVLQAVAKLLNEHPEIKVLDVQGHTDSRGQRLKNVDLSRRRAAAVMRWLIDHGIAAKRLTSRGFGPDRPLDDNGTDAGRQRNRRVEFHVIESEPVSESSPSSAPR